MKIKRILLAALVCVCAGLLLFACGEGASDAGDGPGSDEVGIFDVYFDGKSPEYTNITLQTDKTGRITEFPPDPTRGEDAFVAWFTEPVGGKKISADHVFTDNTSVFAQYTEKGDRPEPDHTCNYDDATANSVGAAGHVYYCRICGEPGAVEAHDYLNGSCRVCGASESEGHVCVFDREVEDPKYFKSDANCDHAAEYYKSCSCGEASTTDTFFAGFAAHGGLDWNPAITATCLRDGRIEYWECKECGRYFSDFECKHEIKDKNSVIVARRSTHGNFTAAVTVAGQDRSVCEYCGREKDRDVFYEIGQEQFDNGNRLFLFAMGGSELEGCVELPSKYNGNDITVVASPSWRGIDDGNGDPVGIFGDRSEYVTELTVPDCYEYDAGGRTFYGCINLTDVNIEADFTDAVTDNMFSGCDRIERATVTGAVCRAVARPSLKRVTVTRGDIESSAFADATDLNYVTLESGVTSIGGFAFNKSAPINYTVESDGSKYLGNSENTHFALISGVGADEISIIHPDTKLLAGYTFYECRDITQAVIPSGIKTIGEYAFCGCDRLQTLILNSGLEMIGVGAFKDCAELSEVEIPNTVRTIERDAFGRCFRLTRVVIPNGVSEIGVEAFIGCELTSLSIPDTVVRIGENAFGCSSIKSLYIGAGVGSQPFETDKPEASDEYELQWLENCIRECVLTDVTVAVGNPVFRSEGNCFISKRTDTLIRAGELFTMPRVSIIGEYSFANLSCTVINIPESVTEIENEAFIGCDQLESITVEESNTVYGSLTGVLYNKEMTQILLIPQNIAGDISLPRYAVSSDIVDVLNGSDKLRNVDVDENNTAYGDFDGIMYSKSTGAVVVYPKAFGRENYRAVTVPGVVTDIGNMVHHGADFREITVSDDNPVYADVDGVLYDKALTEMLLLPSGIVGNITVPVTVVKGCEQLTSANRLSSVTVENGNSAYASGGGCVIDIEKKTVLRGFVGNNGGNIEVTNDGSVEIIGASAFSGWRDDINSVTVPVSVTKIDAFAFAYCGDLIIDYAGTAEQWNAIQKHSNWAMSTNITVHYGG